jgi:molybdate transport system ATP-binding protein
VIEARLRIAHPTFTLDVDLQLPGSGVTALFGPSGCGKTTCLRALAGLERAPQGRVAVNGEVWQDENVWQPTHRRSLGYVFQEASLFNHLSVRGNIEYGLSRVPPARRRVPLEQAVELLGLSALMDRRPATLSGGERQRVGIARALAASPALLLMDEPLAALDAPRKAEVLPYLDRLQRTLDIPVVYVSHAQDEVARLARHLVLLRAGQAVAAGPTQELMARLDVALAQGDAAAAVVPATVTHHDAQDHLTTVRFACGELQLVSPQEHPVGQSVRLRVQARDVSLALVRPESTSILNIVPARITALREDGPGQVMVALDAHGTALLARITQRSAATLALAPGQNVYAQIKAIALLD